MKSLFNRLLKSNEFLLVTAGILIALFIHLIEIEQLGLVSTLHETADDASYLRPPNNLLDTGTWKDNSIGPSSYVQRPPLTGILHLIGRFISGPDNAYGFFTLALLLHGLGIFLFYKTLQHSTTKKWATWGTSLFILLPCFWGFLSYSISEAISIPFLLLGVYFGCIEQEQQTKKIIIAIVLLYLLRPVLILFIIPLLILSIIKRRKRINSANKHVVFTNSILITVVIGFLFWEGRKYYYVQSFSPHPIYHNENDGMFQSPHERVTSLYKIWEFEPEVFHSSILMTNDNQQTIDYFRNYINEKNIPLNSEQLILLNADFVNAIHLNKEASFCKKMDVFTDSIRAKNRYQYYIQTPLRSLTLNLKKSHLNLNLFQERLRGNMLMEIFRVGILTILLLGYGSLLFIFLIKCRPEIKWLSAGGLTYILFLVEYQRMNEDRYFLPSAFIGFLILWILTFRLSEHLKSSRKLNN